MPGSGYLGWGGAKGAPSAPTETVKPPSSLRLHRPTLHSWCSSGAGDATRHVTRDLWAWGRRERAEESSLLLPPVGQDLGRCEDFRLGTCCT